MHFILIKEKHLKSVALLNDRIYRPHYSKKSILKLLKPDQRLVQPMKRFWLGAPVTLKRQKTQTKTNVRTSSAESVSGKARPIQLQLKGCSVRVTDVAKTCSYLWNRYLLRCQIPPLISYELLEVAICSSQSFWPTGQNLLRWCKNRYFTSLDEIFSIKNERKAGAGERWVKINHFHRVVPPMLWRLKAGC